MQLDYGFWKSLKEHPVQFVRRPSRLLDHARWQIDVYNWLPYRLHSLNKTTPVSWPAIRSVLAFKAIRQMKPMFVDAFNLALAVYPEAQVDVEATGLALHPPRRSCCQEARRLGIA